MIAKITNICTNVFVGIGKKILCKHISNYGAIYILIGNFVHQLSQLIFHILFYENLVIVSRCDRVCTFNRSSIGLELTFIAPPEMYSESSAGRNYALETYIESSGLLSWSH